MPYFPIHTFLKTDSDSLPSCIRVKWPHGEICKPNFPSVMPVLLSHIPLPHEEVWASLGLELIPSILPDDDSLLRGEASFPAPQARTHLAAVHNSTLLCRYEPIGATRPLCFRTLDGRTFLSRTGGGNSKSRRCSTIYNYQPSLLAR
jgi:hypothetical protein